MPVAIRGAGASALWPANSRCDRARGKIRSTIDIVMMMQRRNADLHAESDQR
jgi:hypothetical protein